MSTPDPRRWGPIYWDMMHSVALTYPILPSAEKMEWASQMIESLVANLPCPGCRLHAVEYVKNNPTNTTSRIEFATWVNDFHNTVNRRFNKREFTLVESMDRLHEISNFPRESTATVQNVVPLFTPVHGIMSSVIIGLVIYIFILLWRKDPSSLLPSSVIISTNNNRC